MKSDAFHNAAHMPLMLVRAMPPELEAMRPSAGQVQRGPQKPVQPRSGGGSTVLTEEMLKEFWRRASR